MSVIGCHMLRALIALLFVAPFFFMSCSPQPRIPENVLDTPEHHVTSGLKLLQKDYLSDAKREFELALKLDPGCSDAHRGLGLTYGREKSFEPALESMRWARDTAATNKQKALVYVGFMRIYTMEQKEGWLDRVTAMFSDALQYEKDLPDAYFYMGRAFKKAHRAQEAETAFKRVLEINNGLVPESENELKSLLPPR